MANCGQRKRKRKKPKHYLSENRKSKKYREEQAISSSGSSTSNTPLSEINLVPPDDTPKAELVTCENKSVQCSVSNTNHATQCKLQSFKSLSVQTCNKQYSRNAMTQTRWPKVEQDRVNIARKSTSTQTISEVPKIKSVATQTSYGRVSFSENDDNAIDKGRNYKELFNKLSDHAFLYSLLDKLAEEKQINLFVNLLDTLSTGKLVATNLAWKAALYRGKWASCKSTTGIKYDSEYCEFFGILQLIFGAAVICLLRGPAHFGKVRSKDCPRGKFNPDDGKCNFAVPCPRTLSNMKTGYPKNLKCGIIPQSVATLRALSAKGKQFVLSMDGKYVGEGCRGERDGDVDMWGLEGPPTLEANLAKKASLLLQVQELQEEKPKSETISFLRRMVNSISQNVKTLRQRIRGEFFLRNRLLKMVQNNPNKAFGYQQSLSRLHVNSSDCENLCKRSTLVNLELMQLMSHCNGLTALNATGQACTLSSQSNLAILRPPSQIGLEYDMDDPDNSIFCKQGSEEWFALRKLAPITGSSLWRGLGFDTLAKMKAHIREHIKGEVPAPVSEFSAKAMQHGHDYERHGVATIVSCVLPAFKTRCHQFLEVGPIFIPGKVREKLIEVSGDGIIHCINKDCPHATPYDKHRKIAVEIKSPFPTEAVPLEPYYVVPQRHVAQCLSEMVGFNCEDLWLCCVTKKAVTVNIMKYDDMLWKRIFKIITDQYDNLVIKTPNRLHPDLREVREAIKKYTHTHCNFIAEVPMINAFNGIPDEPALPLPYYDSPDLVINAYDPRLVSQQCDVLASETKLLVEESHRVLREPAKEVCLVMACDKDRKHEEFIPNSMPFAFAMKGKYMTNKHMRHIANVCRNVCKDNNIEILAECYDGQWYLYVMFSEDGSPLTRLHLIRIIWTRISKLTKERCLQEMFDATRMKQGDIDMITLTSRFPIGHTKLSNIIITRRPNGTFDVVSRGGNMYPHGIVGNCNFHKNVDVADYVEPKKNTRVVKKVGLQADEKNLLSLLDIDVLEAVEEDTIEENADMADDEYLPDIVSGMQEKLTRVLSGETCTLLATILRHLKEYNLEKWVDFETSDLYPEILCNADMIISKMVVKEMIITAKAVENATGRIWFIAKKRKHENANLIASAFDGKSSNFDKSKDYLQKGVVKPLKYLCKIEVEKDKYHPLLVQVAYANAVHCMKKKMWEDKCPNALRGYIPMEPSSYLPARYIRYYSYPEKSKERNQIEHKTLDYTHMLTNMRAHILRKGYEFCQSKVFQEIAADRPDILSRALVFDLTDKQNAYSAMRMFGVPVERELRRRGYHSEADFVELVRNWHRACDERGMTADDRVIHLEKFLQYLLEDVNLDQFPFKHTGRYVKSIPYQTFDAICQNITCRIQLYELSLQKMYSSRSISTLPCESMFSDLVRFDRESNGYVKACNVGAILGRVVAINYVKHKPSKTYFLLPTTRGTYPVHVLEWYGDEAEGNTGSNGFYYQNHHFDKVNRNPSSRRKRRSDISTGIAPMRGVTGVRMYHRVNERLINPETRAGRPITRISDSLAKLN